ncbi:MAG: CXXX repeat peptide maturase [Dysgonamonadaceae bacterium]|jgi:CXXX repeat peptide maturase|nr:CXXX repeat peptide maturase [Dysgonamonadaceae bacterium]
MLQYLVILLDDTSVSYCHYENPKKVKRLISLSDLKAGILFAMKQNLMIQFVYPDYEIPAEYQKEIETIDHHKIAPQKIQLKNADVVVFNSCKEFSTEKTEENKDKIFVLRANGKDVARNVSTFAHDGRLNIIITDIETFTENDFSLYKETLEQLKNTVKEIFLQENSPQVNLLTDRILLEKMNNCNAGIENITLAPNGKFYICPAFYLEDENDTVGNLTNCIDIKNKHLYKLSNAPICQKCDAYQCKRCVWLNRKTTREVNTPSHEQCVVAHLERNASRNLLLDLQQLGAWEDKSIKAIDYFDPFEVKDKF